VVRFFAPPALVDLLVVIFFAVVVCFVTAPDFAAVGRFVAVARFVTDLAAPDFVFVDFAAELVREVLFVALPGSFVGHDGTLV